MSPGPNSYEVSVYCCSADGNGHTLSQEHVTILSKAPEGHVQSICRRSHHRMLCSGVWYRQEQTLSCTHHNSVYACMYSERVVQ